MTTYLALLRGVNVGGKGIIKMSELQAALTAAGLQDVRTYIQSGNVIFSSKISDTDKLAAKVSRVITDSFNLSVGVAVFSKNDWKHIISNAPKWWGSDTTWKHNLLIMIGKSNMAETLQAIGVLKPEIEKVEAGQGVLYQSLSFKLFGRTTSGKLAGNPIYKRMTIRNYNTATKLLGRMD